MTLTQFLQKKFWVIVAITIAIWISIGSPAPSWSTNTPSSHNVVEQKTTVAQQQVYIEPQKVNIEIHPGVVNFNVVKTATFPHLRTGVEDGDVFYAQLVCYDLDPKKDFKQNRLHDRSKMIKLKPFSSTPP